MGILAQLHEVTGQNHTRNTGRWTPENVIAPLYLPTSRLDHIIDGPPLPWPRQMAPHSVSPPDNMFYCPLFWASMEYKNHLHCRFHYYSAFFASFKEISLRNTITRGFKFELIHLSSAVNVVLKPILDTTIKSKQMKHCLNIAQSLTLKWSQRNCYCQRINT